MTFFDLHLATGRITRVTPDYPGWSNFYVSADSRHFVFGVQTKPDQPREYTLYTVELPALP